MPMPVSRSLASDVVGGKANVSVPPFDDSIEKLMSAMDAGLDALQAAGDMTDWHAALGYLARWKQPVDNGDVQAISSKLLHTAMRLPIEVQPEVWRALSELRDTPWLPSEVLLELAVGNCLAFTEPEVVAAFLVARICEGSPILRQCLEFCFSRFLNSGRSEQVRLAKLLNSLVGSVDLMLERQPDDELTLPSLSILVELAGSGRIAAAALPPLCGCLENLLQHLAPATMNEQAWVTLRQLLGRHQGSSTAVAGIQQKGSQQSPELVQQCTPCQETAGDSTRASSEDTAELASTLARVHRVVVDLSKAEDEAPTVLHVVTQLLTRQSCAAPLRAYMRRLLIRQRLKTAAKENLPPSPAMPAASKQHSNSRSDEFIEADYASVRELAADEGLVGVFPLSLLGVLRRLLGAPATIGTHRAAAECLGAVAAACGPLLLRVLLHMFAGALLRLASARGPAQGPARSTLRLFAVLSEQAAQPGTCLPPRWLRPVWRALAQATCRRTGGNGAETNDPALVAEALRWLVDDALSVPGAIVGAEAVREILAPLAPALRDRSASTREVAARVVSALARVRGEPLLRGEVQAHPLLSSAEKAAVMTALTRAVAASAGGADELAGTATSLNLHGLGTSATPPAHGAIARSPSAGAACGQQAQTAPSKVPGQQGSAATMPPTGLGSSSSSRPRRLQFSPHVHVSDDPVSPPPSASISSFLRMARGTGSAGVGSAPAPASSSTSSLAARIGAAAAAAAVANASADAGDPTAQASAQSQQQPQRPGLRSSQSAPDLQAARRKAAEARAAEAARAPSVAASPSRRPAVPEPLALPPALPRTSDSGFGGSNAAAGASADTTTVSSTGGGELGLEEELRLWAEAPPSASRADAWTAFFTSLAGRLERVLLRSTSAEIAPIVLATLTLCERLAAAATAAADNDAECQRLLSGALAVASAARGAFADKAVLGGLCAATAAPAFRSTLRTLSQLQRLSASALEADAANAGRRHGARGGAAARALLELPPLLAALIDALEPSTQLTAWLRIAAELLAEAEEAEREGLAVEPRADVAGSAAADAVSTRRWALRFCERCVERTAPMLRPDGPEFAAWELMTELSRLHALVLDGQPSLSAGAGADNTSAWAVDCREWYRVLESSALVVAERCPAQVREFLLLASCTGSPMPRSLEGLLENKERGTR
eukprot:TRINITY_DN14154_c0_g1_i1.p1 TRINITY_DN14154_c0_g1~~TRINITY_DN14154_c0_g1_i1.p1  ORF type:complete len:1182 (-),score=212.07 TRINITY_DN14154_c0_g1_i1:45-3590(-)